MMGLRCQSTQAQAAKAERERSACSLKKMNAPVLWVRGVRNATPTTSLQVPLSESQTGVLQVAGREVGPEL